MWATLASFLAGMFSSSKMTDTAIDAIRKVGNLDEMSQQEKADFIIKYLNTTKHQSVARRFIAILLAILYAFCIIVFVIGAAVGHGFDMDSMINFSDNLKVFMTDVILMPFNLVLSFYFVINIAEKLKS
jgi:hypothetical protein